VILGFAHLMVNTDDIDTAEEAWRARGYQRSAYHQKAPNHPSKEAYTGSYHPEHDLLLMAGEGLWPLELTCHGAISGENRQITWGAEQLELACPQPEQLRALFEQGLGFKPQEDGSLELAARLPSWRCRVLVAQSDAPPPRLDAAGATGLAFYVRRIAEEAETLQALGATDMSGVFNLSLGERAMKIALMRAPGGPLIELIELDAKALRS